jgi:hypothetical protein
MRFLLLCVVSLLVAGQVAVSAPVSNPKISTYHDFLKVEGHQPGELFDALSELAELMGVEIHIESDVSSPPEVGYWESAEFTVEGSKENVAAFKKEYHHLRSEYLGR